MALRSEEGGGGLRCWLCSRRACIVVGGAAVLSSVLYALYRYYRSRRDSDLSKDEGFEDTTKVCIVDCRTCTGGYKMRILTARDMQTTSVCRVGGSSPFSHLTLTLTLTLKTDPNPKP